MESCKNCIYNRHFWLQRIGSRKPSINLHDLYKPGTWHYSTRCSIRSISITSIHGLKFQSMLPNSICGDAVNRAAPFDNFHCYAVLKQHNWCWTLRKYLIKRTSPMQKIASKTTHVHDLPGQTTSNAASIRSSTRASLRWTLNNFKTSGVQGCDKGVGNMPGIPWPKDSEIWINFDAQLTGKFLFLCKDHLSEYIEGS